MRIGIGNPVASLTRARREEVRPGEYLHSDRDLFCVVELSANRVLVEDCRTGMMVDADIADVLRLEPVRRSTAQGAA